METDEYAKAVGRKGVIKPTNPADWSTDHLNTLHDAAIIPKVFVDHTPQQHLNGLLLDTNTHNEVSERLA